MGIWFPVLAFGLWLLQLLSKLVPLLSHSASVRAVFDRIVRPILLYAPENFLILEQLDNAQRWGRRLTPKTAALVEELRIPEDSEYTLDEIIGAQFHVSGAVELRQHGE